MNASQQWTGDVAPLGGKVGATGFVRGAPQNLKKSFNFGRLKTQQKSALWKGIRLYFLAIFLFSPGACLR
jgi:hypothetical protein